MVSIPLRFVPPEVDNIVTLHIWEGPTSTGPFTEIDATPIGTYPAYITEYITEQASSLTDWFAIQWENSGGGKSPLSAPIQGGTTTLIGELVERVLLRSDALNENVVLQEAEFTVSWVYRITDPYTIDINTVSKLWLNGLAELTLIASLYINAVENQATTQAYSAGMVSESQGSSKDVLDGLERWEKRILRKMGIGGSLLASFNLFDRKAFNISGEIVSVDASRLLSVKSIVTERILVQDIPSGFTISVD